MDKRFRLYHNSVRVRHQNRKSISKTKNKGVVVVHVPKKFIGHIANIIIYAKR